MYNCLEIKGVWFSMFRALYIIGVLAFSSLLWAGSEPIQEIKDWRNPQAAGFAHLEAYNEDTYPATFQCSATFLSPTHLLTTAHCVYSGELSKVFDQIYVFPSRVGVSRISPSRIYVKRLYVSKAYIREIAKVEKTSLKRDKAKLELESSNLWASSEDKAIVELSQPVNSSYWPTGFKGYKISKQNVLRNLRESSGRVHSYPKAYGEGSLWQEDCDMFPYNHILASSNCSIERISGASFIKDGQILGMFVSILAEDFTPLLSVFKAEEVQEISNILRGNLEGLKSFKKFDLSVESFNYIRYLNDCQEDIEFASYVFDKYQNIKESIHSIKAGESYYSLRTKANFGFMGFPNEEPQNFEPRAESYNLDASVVPRLYKVSLEPEYALQSGEFLVKICGIKN